MLEIAVTNAVIASLLACLVFVIGRVYEKPALSHALWILVLVKLLVWPIADLTIPKTVQSRFSAATLDWSSKPFAAESNERVPLVVRGPVSPRNLTVQENRERAFNAPQVTDSLPNLLLRSLSWKSLALGIWLVGSLAFAARAVAGILRFRIATHDARAIDSKLNQIAKDVADQYQLSVPKIRLTSETMSPVVWCFLSRPTVYVPQPLLDELDDRQTATLLAHEFAHIKRRDIRRSFRREVLHDHCIAKLFFGRADTTLSEPCSWQPPEEDASYELQPAHQIVATFDMRELVCQKCCGLAIVEFVEQWLRHIYLSLIHI